MSVLGSLVDGAFQIGGQALGQYYNKKNMRDQARIQYDYAQRYAENTPTWSVNGLRNAGLNPILAVSNGVNLGANIPNISNSSPDGKINTKFTEALGRSFDRFVNKQNADANTVNADSNQQTAEANMVRAKADAALKQAQTAETLQRTKFEGEGKGYKSDTINDLVRGASLLSDSAIDFNKEAEHYLDHAPRDFRDTLSDTDRKIYNDLEKVNGKGSAKEISNRFRDKYDTWRFSRSRSHSSIFTR